MRNALRWAAVAVVVVHGLIHLLGGIEGLGWARVGLAVPMTVVVATGWLLVGALLVVTALLRLRPSRWWWALALIAALLSQALILTAWPEAATGTAANLLLLVAALQRWASYGPRSARERFRRRLEAVSVARRDDMGSMIADTDLVPLPAQVAAYLRRTGCVGQPRIGSFRARGHGRIRAGPTRPWMSFRCEQVNTFGAEPSRLFFMDATMFGLPVDVLHVFEGSSATMEVRLASLFPIARAAGPHMDRSETVTLFNDMCIMAPAALLHAPVEWREVSDGRVEAVCRRGEQVVSAELIFGESSELVDFVSDDRSRVSPDGRSGVAQRWSTPLSHYTDFGPNRLASHGQGIWHAPEPEGSFVYLELVLDEIEHYT